MGVFVVFFLHDTYKFPFLQLLHEALNQGMKHTKFGHALSACLHGLRVHLLISGVVLHTFQVSLLHLFHLCNLHSCIVLWPKVGFTYI